MTDLIEKVEQAQYRASVQYMSGVITDDKAPIKEAIKAVLSEMLIGRTKKSTFRWNIEQFAKKHGIEL